MPTQPRLRSCSNRPFMTLPRVAAFHPSRDAREAVESLERCVARAEGVGLSSEGARLVPPDRRGMPEIARRSPRSAGAARDCRHAPLLLLSRLRGGRVRAGELSAISRLYLGCISVISRLYLGYISASACPGHGLVRPRARKRRPSAAARRAAPSCDRKKRSDEYFREWQVNSR